MRSVKCHQIKMGQVVYELVMPDTKKYGQVCLFVGLV